MLTQAVAVLNIIVLLGYYSGCEKENKQKGC